jgi:predicted DNA-binding transcriptional regulator AlpA
MNEQQSTLTTKNAASYLGISGASSRLWRADNKGPRYFRAGTKLVRYLRTDLDSWIQARLNEPLDSE